VKRCPSCGEENAERARFCQNCATSLSEAETPAADVRKVVTIVFADVTGSTALGERLDPEALRRVMGRYFDEMAAVIQRHGGTVEKFIGDAVMAVFGIPRLHEDDALRAVRAAIGMGEALATLNGDLERMYGERLGMRIGVNTGEVVAGDPTAGQRLVTGDPVNVSARLEQAAAPDEVLLGLPTYRLVRDAVDVEPVEPLTLKGKQERVPAYRLLAVSAHTAGHERHLDSPMIGRTEELSVLEHALERAVTDRTPHLFTLMGSAGVGKSRLVQEFLTRNLNDATVLHGRCLSYGEGITFFPLADVVRQAARIVDTDAPEVARSKLDVVVAGAPQGERVARLVAGLFGWAEPGSTEDAFWAVRRLLEHLARDRPVVVVFDDIHWGEPTFLDLIDHLSDWTRDAAVLLLCIARPELLEVRPGWGGERSNATSILLDPLPGDEASRLVDNLLGRAEIPRPVRERILGAAEGNPLFVEEMLGMLIDDGLLRFEDGAWRSAADLADVTVPPTIHLLLAARLDRLDAEERGTIERGSVEGQVFHVGAVATLSPATLRPRVSSLLLGLARKLLIRPDRAEFAGDDAFRFRHLLIRDAAYQAMAKEQRADLHERFADWLARAASGRMTEYEEILAHHLEQAYRYRVELTSRDDRAIELGRRAGRHLLACAQRADEREDLLAAKGFLQRCIELVPDAPERLRATVLLSQVLEEDADYQAGCDTAMRAIAMAEELGDRSQALRASLILTMSRGQVEPSHSIGMSIAEASEILDEARLLGDPVLADRASLLLARLTFFVGETARSVELLDELIPRSAGMSRRDVREIQLQLSTCVYFGPLPVEEALEVVQRAGQLQKESLASDALTFRATGGLLNMAGRFEEASAALDRALQLFGELGDPVRGTIARQIDGEAFRLQGRYDEAERVFRKMIETLDVVGETGFNSTVSGLLALTLCDLERYDEAGTYASRSREMAAEDDIASQAAWRMARARVQAHVGEFDDALRLADEAIAINDRTDYPVWQGDGREVRGIVLEAAGRGDDAREAYEEAIDRYERKGNVVAAGRVRKRLVGNGSVPTT
jgi:class 3 adenylate cyclase/tetratricopeptide (TPR) repeat protein